MNKNNDEWKCKYCGKELGFTDYPICPYCKKENS